MFFIYIFNSAMKRELALALNFCLLSLIAWLPNTYSKITVHGVPPPFSKEKIKYAFVELITVF